MKTWIPQVQTFLDELLRAEGRNGFVAETCPECPEDSPTRGEPKFRCLGCSPGPLLCASCVSRKHTHLPFHRVQVRLFLHTHRVYWFNILLTEMDGQDV